MLPSFLTRIAARAVLISYVTQLLAPVYAAEIAEPAVKREFTTALPGQDIPLSPYQYRLMIQPQREGAFKLNLSRQLKEGQDGFQKLYRSLLQEGQVITKVWDQDERGADPLAQQFKELSCSLLGKQQGHWHIPGFGNIKTARDGTVFFDQEDSAASLSSCDLIIHTTGNLHLQALTCQALTLQSPRTYINGILCVEHLKTDFQIINEGAVRFKNLSGHGTFINHSFVKVEGDASIGIHAFKNIKTQGTSSHPKLEGNNLQITADNHLFHNNKGSEMTLGKLVIDSSENGLFLNKETIKTKETIVKRDNVVNTGRWASDVVMLSGIKFHNKEEGELIARKKFTLERELENDAKVTTRGLAEIGTLKSATGRLTNNGTWNHEGNLQLGQYAEESGNIVVLSNREKGEINWKNGSCSSISKQWINIINRGTWILEAITGSTRMDLSNEGFFQLKDSSITLENFDNEKIGKMILSPESELAVFHLSYNDGLFEGGRIRSYHKGLFSSIRNKGTMIVRGILGTGKFLNLGHLRLDGSEEQPAQIDIEEFHNSQRKFPGTDDSEGQPEVIGQYITVGSTNKKIVNAEKGRITTQGLFDYQKGHISNDGVWHHIGDLSLGITSLFNNRTGNILWEQGRWIAQSQNAEVRERDLKWQRSDGKSEVAVFKRKETTPPPQHLISYINKGKWVYKDIKGYGDIDLKNEEEGILNITDKSYLWIDQFHNAPKAQMIFSPTTNLKCHEQLNMGLFQADVIYMCEAKFINCGTTMVNTLVGYAGDFRNLGQLNMVGTASKPALLCNYYLKNGYSVKDKVVEFMEKAYRDANMPMPTPHFNGAYIKVGKGYFDLTNYKNGQIDTQGDFKAVKNNWFTNQGIWNHKGDLEFTESTLSNAGMMDFKGTFVGDRAKIRNNKGGSWRSEDRIDLNEVLLENEGMMSWRYATLVFAARKKEGSTTKLPIENKGTWILGGVKFNQKLDVVNNGILQLDFGTLNFSSLKNNKQLIFKGGCYAIDNFDNKGLIKFLGRKWTITREDLPRSGSRWWYDQDGQLQIINHFRDTGILESSYPLTFDYPMVPYAPRLKHGMVLPELPKNSLDSLVQIGCFKFSTCYSMPAHLMGEHEIYAEKDYRSTTIKYKLKDSLNHPNAKNGIIEGSFITWDFDLYNNWFDNEDLQKYAPKILKELTEKGYIHPTVPSITTRFEGDLSPLKSYIFNNINLLDLTINGTFNLLCKLHVGTVKLTIHGDIIFGKNNDVMGSLAATDGPLTVTAWGVDARFGQLYGAKATKIKATDGDILVGYAKEKPHDLEKNLGWCSAYTEVVGTKYAFTTVSDVNGSYIRSGDTLDLQGNNLDLSYAQIFSKGKATFIAKDKIEALRAIIKGNGEASWKAKVIHIGRTPMQNLCIGWMSSYYTCEWGWATRSDQSEVHYGSTITFNTPKLKVCASTISSYRNIFIKKNDWDFSALSTEDGHQNPSSLELANHYRTTGYNYYFYPKILARQDIAMTMDDINIMGMLNAGTLTFEATNTAVFQNESRARQTIIPAAALVDITAFAQKLAELGGYLKLTDNQEVKPDFSENESPFVFKPNQTIFLVNPGNPRDFRPPLRFIDPMRHFSASMWDMLLQPISVTFLGKVGFREDYGSSPLKTLLWFTENWTRKMGRHHIFPEELESLVQAIFIRQCVEKDKTTFVHTLLAAPKEEVNPNQSDGDISGNRFSSKTGKDMRFENTRVVMKDTIRTKASGDTDVTTTTTTTVYKNAGVTISTTKADPQATMKAPRIHMEGDGNLTNTGSYTEAKNLTEKFGGTITENTVVESQTTTRESSSGGFFNNSSSISVDTQTNHLPTVKVAEQYISESKTGIVHNAPVHYGNQRYKAPSFQARATMSANVHYSHTETENACGSTTATTSYEEHPTVSQPTYYGDKIIFDCPITEITAADIIGLVVDLSAAKQKLFVGPELVHSAHHHQSTGQTPLSSYDVGQSGWRKDVLPTRIRSDKVILPSGPGTDTILDTVDLTEIKEIIGNYVEKTTKPEIFQTQWAHHDQVIPQEAMIVIALAVSYVTANPGLLLGESLFGIGTVGSVMFQAGFQTLCTGAATSLASTGDLLKTVKEMVSDRNLLHVATSMASAGLLHKLTPACGINTTSGYKPLMSHLKEHVLRRAVNSGLTVVTGRQGVDSALKDMAKSIPLDAVAAYVSNNIGELYKDKEIGYGVHKMAHALSGGVAGWIMDPNRDGFIAGAQGALTAEVVGEALLSNARDIGHAAVDKLVEERKPLTPQNIDKAIDSEIQKRIRLAKLAAGTLAIATKRDVSISMETASNAVDNNLLPFALAAAPQAYAAAQLIIASPQFLLVTQMTAAGLAAMLAKDQIDTHYKKKHGNQHKKPFSSQGPQAVGQTGTSSASGGAPDPQQDPNNKNGKHKRGKTLPVSKRAGIMKARADKGDVKKYDLSKYSVERYENGQKVRINPQTGDKIFKERAGDRAHGGSAYKRIVKGVKETLDKDGVVLRINKLKQ